MNLKRSGLSFFLFFTVNTLLSAAAVTLPPAVYSGQIDGRTISSTGATSGVSVVTTGIVPVTLYGVDTLSISASPVPSISVSASSLAFFSGTPFPGGPVQAIDTANGQITYSIQFQGPTSTVLVDTTYLLKAALGTGSAYLSGSAYAAFAVNQGTTRILLDQANAGQNISGSKTWLADTGVVYTVYVFASAQTDSHCGTISGLTACSGGILNASAMADPTFSIDSSVVNAADYSILVSDGVGNPVATPEPGTLALLIPASLLGLGLVRKSSKLSGSAQ